jgi:hypothetical protein
VVILNVVEVVNVVEVSDIMMADVLDADENTVEFASVCVWRFNVIVPGPVNVTVIGLFEPEHASPPEQLQFEKAYPYGM